MRSLFSVKHVAKVTAGSVTASALTATWSDGARLGLEYCTDFGTEGGVFVIDPDNAPEVGYFTSIDDSTEELTGVTRPNAAIHAAGVFIQSGSEPTFEKVATGSFGDAPDAEVSGVPIRSLADAYFPLGYRVEGTEETVWVEMDDDDEPWIVDAPKDAAKTFDGDLVVLPSPGGGDDSGATTDPNTGKVLPPPGQGWPDGIAPVGTVVAEAFGGIGNAIHVNWTTIANSTQVNYEVHVSTTTGFIPGATTLYSTHSLAGNTSGIGAETIKDFPLGHALDGTASDPPQPGTTYFIKIKPKDESGAGPTSAQVSATPVKIATVAIDTGAITEALLAANAVTVTKIADGSISTPKLVAGAVTTATIAAGAITTGLLAALAVSADKIAANTITSGQIAANTIVAGNIAALTITAAELAANSVTAAKLSVSTLSAITADLGTVTAGSITGGTISGVTITGGTFRTAASGTRVEITDSGGLMDRINFHVGAALMAQIIGTSSGLSISVGVGSILSISGALNHTGSTYGLCGAGPSARETIDSLAVGADLAAVRAKVNNLMDMLRTKGHILGT